LKDTKKILRQAIFNALDGQITLNGETVPVYDEKNENESVYILLSNQQEFDDSPDGSFITRSTIDYEVVQQTGYSVSKDDIDDINEQILEILIPSQGTTGLTIPSGFQFHNVKRESSRSIAFEISPTESIVRNITTISTIIQEQ
jgi:hypothetical protein